MTTNLPPVLSRCGLCCDTCEYRESHGCEGCIASGGKPFWGECDVAKCCANKGLMHCGQCSELPCDDLRNMSCGEDEHCDTPPGKRIEMCKAWAKQERGNSHA